MICSRCAKDAPNVHTCSPSDLVRELEDQIARLNGQTQFCPMCEDYARKIEAPLLAEIATLNSHWPPPGKGWACFHCGEVFTTPGGAQDHFGAGPMDTAACRIKVGEERGLVMALRKAQEELVRYRNEDSDQDRAMAQRQCDHQTALQRQEELGYGRGLKDAGLSDIQTELSAAQERIKQLEIDNARMQRTIDLASSSMEVPNFTTQMTEQEPGHHKDALIADLDSRQEPVVAQVAEPVAWLVDHADGAIKQSVWMHRFDPGNGSPGWINRPLYLHPAPIPEDMQLVPTWMPIDGMPDHITSALLLHEDGRILDADFRMEDSREPAWVGRLCGLAYRADEWKFTHWMRRPAEPTAAQQSTEKGEKT